MPDRRGAFVVMDRTGAPLSTPCSQDALVGCLAMWCANVWVCDATEQFRPARNLP